MKDNKNLFKKMEAFFEDSTNVGVGIERVCPFCGSHPDEAAKGDPVQFYVVCEPCEARKRRAYERNRPVILEDSPPLKHHPVFF